MTPAQGTRLRGRGAGIGRPLRAWRYRGNCMPELETLISVRDLAARSSDASLRVLDCRFDLMAPDRGRTLFHEGHIPRAQFADLDHDLAGPVGPDTGRHPLPAPAALAARLGTWGITPATRVVVYDAGNSALAAHAWWLLRWLGHDAVAVLDGGLAAWLAAGAPLECDAAPVDAVPAYHPSPRDERVVTTAEIVRALQAGSPLTLVDAREAVRFRGESEPIDPVAGHIPGALNFPLARSLEPDGRFRPPADLAATWREVLPDAAAGRWTAMCGSGVTACHLALSARLAGLREPRVYVGSWSEWIRDSGRPIALGP
jgi:thiosulfate/3-mercaptopyruvate sulfurtransferase